MQLLLGDCLDKLKELPENSVDSLVTDPPYGWRFMGKSWDGEDIVKTFADKQAGPKDTMAHAAGLYDQSLSANQSFQLWTTQWAREVYRVLKPGAHGLVACGPRTHHRMMSGLEDAGFEIRDCIMWLFGSGFPKSMDISKAIDKQAGVEREVAGYVEVFGREGCKSKQNASGDIANAGAAIEALNKVTTPATDAAKQWQGYGTALKPAWEVFALVRKPCSEKTVAANVLRWGVGGINVDGSRIGLKPGETTHGSGTNQGGTIYSGQDSGFSQIRIGAPNIKSTQGRFPANLIFSHTLFCDEEKCDDSCAVKMLDEQSGNCKSRGEYKNFTATAKGMFQGGNPKEPNKYANEQGGASRFFYCAKVSSSERNAGLEGMPDIEAGIGDERPSGQSMSRLDGRAPRIVKNSHPTVKPQKLMRYLCRLITPPGGTVLDCFLGSGSTGVAALAEGFKFIGIERN